MTNNKINVGIANWNVEGNESLQRAINKAVRQFSLVIKDQENLPLVNLINGPRLALAVDDLPERIIRLAVAMVNADNAFKRLSELVGMVDALEAAKTTEDEAIEAWFSNPDTAQSPWDYNREESLRVKEVREVIIAKGRESFPQEAEDCETWSAAVANLNPRKVETFAKSGIAEDLQPSVWDKNPRKSELMALFSEALRLNLSSEQVGSYTWRLSREKSSVFSRKGVYSFVDLNEEAKDAIRSNRWLQQPLLRETEEKRAEIKSQVELVLNKLQGALRSRYGFGVEDQEVTSWSDLKTIIQEELDSRTNGVKPFKASTVVWLCWPLVSSGDITEKELIDLGGDSHQEEFEAAVSLRKEAEVFEHSWLTGPLTRLAWDFSPLNPFSFSGEVEVQIGPRTIKVHGLAGALLAMQIARLPRLSGLNGKDVRNTLISLCQKATMLIAPTEGAISSDAVIWETQVAAIAEANKAYPQVAAAIKGLSIMKMAGADWTWLEDYLLANPKANRALRKLSEPRGVKLLTADGNESKFWTRYQKFIVGLVDRAEEAHNLKLVELKAIREQEFRLPEEVDFETKMEVLWIETQGLLNKIVPQAIEIAERSLVWNDKYAMKAAEAVKALEDDEEEFF